ncbi:MAG TPA: Stp1/IreP family PP2C-type Ser/Thr phosphatase, partial [Solirubrobacteraceae bacterium]|nr:Stp1/IreP family PP2C-type Ser/Thr phosphatase [Solirubrobacteraceae bacterium]
MLRAVETVCRSDTGRQRRENEDSAFAAAPLFVVADGMGGAQAGEVASRLAIETFQRGLAADGSPEQRLAERVRDANRRIYEKSRTESGREGMGTTLTAAYVDDGQLAIAHVGDSRAYLFRDGELTRLTQDHSLVDELLRQGKLTEEEAAEHPQRSIITRALGPEADVDVDTFTYAVQAGDLLLLCSDGLTSMISEEAVAGVLASAGSLSEAAKALIEQANQAGGRDNITVVLFRLEEVTAGPGSSLKEEPTSAEEPTIIGGPAPSGPSAQPADGRSAVAVAPLPAARVRPRAPERPASAPPSARRLRFTTPVAATVAVLVVLFLVGGGGYLATRQLYFIGTNAQGIVTIYRGLPYSLPAGIPLYETYFVSGVPASLVPADR